jgi:hypothetical protein
MRCLMFEVKVGRAVLCTPRSLGIGMPGVPALLILVSRLALLRMRRSLDSKWRAHIHQKN